LLGEFKPQMLFISAGFDAHKDDPLAQIMLVEDDYEYMTAALKTFCDKKDIGIISTLEGGYNLKALPLSVEAHLKVFKQ